MENGLYNDIYFEIIDTQGNIQRVTGVYMIVDGGYQKIKWLIDPSKITSKLQHIYYSEWLESVRKDVECLNASLKNRWQILYNRVQYHSLTDIDNILNCCCIIHNMLLIIDGLSTSAWALDVNWELLNPDVNEEDDGYQSDDMNCDSDAGTVGVEMLDDPQPLVYSALNNMVLLTEDNVTASFNSCSYVKKTALVNHFVQLFNHGLVQWPKSFDQSKRSLFK